MAVGCGAAGATKAAGGACLWGLDMREWASGWAGVCLCVAGCVVLGGDRGGWVEYDGLVGLFQACH